MARIFAPNENHNFDIDGVTFINGAGAVPSANTDVVAWFTSKGYTIKASGDTLTFWDKLTKAQLLEFAAEQSIADAETMTKADLITAIEAVIATIP